VNEFSVNDRLTGEVAWRIIFLSERLNKITIKEIIISGDV
jgi:hypothetical protein